VKEAARLLRRVLKSDPDDPRALHALATLEAERGDTGAAADHLKRLVAGEPGNAAACHDLARVLGRMGRLDEALAHMRAAAELEPDSSEIHNNLGALEEQSGNLPGAIACFRRAAELAPANAVPLVNLGEALLGAGDPGQAVQHLRVAATLDPDQGEAWRQLGAALMAMGQAEQAVGALRRAALLSDDDAGAHRSLADGLRTAGRLDDAIEAYRRALALDAQSADAWDGLGHAELDSKRFAAAVHSFNEYLELEPEDGRARHDLGVALHDLGLIGPALAQLRRAASLGPDEVTTRARETMAVIVPGDPASGDREILALRRAWQRPPADSAPRSPAGIVGAGDMPLRVGYVSYFFDRRNWMKPVWGLINQHDRRRFEIHLFSDKPVSRIDSGYQPHPLDHVHYIGDADNQAAARAIADSGIDLLIDLNGYSRFSRLPLFDYKPAPVIAGWFNMFATTGMDSFDYLIGDSDAIPVDEEGGYVERILRVPGSYLTFEVGYEVPEISPPPRHRSGVFTFGSLASQYKITDQVVQCWATILERSGDSRLFLKNAALGDEANREHLRRRFVRCGVDADRIELEGPSEHYEFLKAYRRIDVALDSFPYNGGTTTTEAIWQGVPVVTFYGDRWAGRTSASILRAAGLPEFVAGDIGGYIDVCVKLATAPEAAAELDTLRTEARDRLRRAPVCATQSFAREMEALYLEMCGLTGTAVAPHPVGDRDEAGEQ
jgi:predicted O-linked N-acetylglucosamine transferase (SPINDLY family)